MHYTTTTTELRPVEVSKTTLPSEVYYAVVAKRIIAATLIRLNLEIVDFRPVKMGETALTVPTGSGVFLESGLSDTRRSFFIVETIPPVKSAEERLNEVWE